MALLLL
jgi:hypothetical protein